MTRITWVMGHESWSRGSWVSSLMGRMGHGSQNVTQCTVVMTYSKLRDSFTTAFIVKQR